MMEPWEESPTWTCRLRSTRARIRIECSYLEPSVGVVVGRTLPFVLAVACAVAGSAAIGAIVLRALSDDYIARDGGLVGLVMLVVAARTAPEKPIAPSAINAVTLFILMFPRLAAGLIPQRRKATSLGGPYSDEGASSLGRGRFRFSGATKVTARPHF